MIVLNIEQQARPYPIMASKCKMIRCKASIPVGIFGGDDIDVIPYCLSNGTEIMRVAHIHKPNQHCHTVGKKINMRFLRISSPKLLVHLNLMYKISLH